MEEKHFKADAKSIVDLAFDTKLFKEGVTRDAMTTFEELIEYMMRSRFETYVKIERLTSITKGVQ